MIEVATMEEGSSEKKKWRTMREELKKVGTIAAPMVIATVLQYLVQVVSLIMVGHLNQLSLASVAIATSLTNVSGFSVLVSRFSVHLNYCIFNFEVIVIISL